MLQNDFQFFANLMIFFSKKKNDQIFPFHIYFSHLCKTSTPPPPPQSLNVYLNVFNHIVTFRKNYMNFCV
jgi:hypothetical protein